jgi:hypothetical protein
MPPSLLSPQPIPSGGKEKNGQLILVNREISFFVAQDITPNLNQMHLSSVIKWIPSFAILDFFIDFPRTPESGVGDVSAKSKQLDWMDWVGLQSMVQLGQVFQPDIEPTHWGQDQAASP